MQDNFLDLIAQAGVVGAGGAGFPTHVKLKAQAEIVIINGAECEPLLRVDQQLMAIQANRLLQGLSMLVEHVGAKRGVVALKAHYQNAIKALNSELPKFSNLSIHQLGEFYPAGDEQVLVYEVTGKIVPEGGIPLNVGAVVSNVETVLNIMNAVENSTPVIDKYVTITGAVAHPKTVKVPLGVKVSEMIELAGGATVYDYCIINGGPMMGRVVLPESPVTKTTKGLIVLPADHPLLVSHNKPVPQMLREAAGACMQCSLCTEVCPRNLLGHRIEPHKMMRVAAYGSLCDPEYAPMNAYLCVGCRLCEYACVMGLQPWKFNGIMKGNLGKNGIRNNLNNTPDHVHPSRDYKRYPIGKLITQLGLSKFNVDAPLDDSTVKPGVVSLALRQGVGAPSAPVVKVGDKVSRGDLVAQIPEGSLGTNLHSSIDGEVVAVTEQDIQIK